jgi:hypothetical protein
MGDIVADLLGFDEMKEKAKIRQIIRKEVIVECIEALWKYTKRPELKEQWQGIAFSVGVLEARLTSEEEIA